MNNNKNVRVLNITENDQSWIERFYLERWGSIRVVSKGELHHVPSLSGILAWKSGQRIGLLTYHIQKSDFQIVTLDSLVENVGVGSALISRAVELAHLANCQRVWLITTNDNTTALHFYQKRGFRLVAIYPNALDYSRKLKPEIPEIGLNGIPMRDEIELELPFNSR
jgi:ribosomal protein S18 acetylase RimI-like enzyme